MTDEWIKKMWHIYIMEYYAAIKENEIMQFVTTWMGLKIIMLSEISQTRQISYDITCIWDIKYDTNELTKQK